MCRRRLMRGRISRCLFRSVAAWNWLVLLGFFADSTTFLLVAVEDRDRNIMPFRQVDIIGVNCRVPYALYMIVYKLPPGHLPTQGLLTSPSPHSSMSTTSPISGRKNAPIASLVNKE